MLRLVALVLALLLQSLAADAQEPQPGPRVGDVYEIRSDSVSSQSSSEGSSGNSTSRNLIVERVIALRDSGVELEFDLPQDASAEDRGPDWQFPVRVFQPLSEPLLLLNGPELEARAEAWLRAAELPREACGRWIFTWNAFRIECDPQSAIEMVAAVDLRVTDLRDGAPYREDGARGPAALRRQSSGRDGAVFVVRLEVDPDAVRRRRAQVDIVVAEINGRSLALDTALPARSAERVSGTIAITFETDGEGRVRRRTKVTELEIESPGGSRETETMTETVERRLVSRPGS